MRRKGGNFNCTNLNQRSLYASLKEKPSLLSTIWDPSSDHKVNKFQSTFLFKYINKFERREMILMQGGETRNSARVLSRLEGSGEMFVFQ